MSYKNHNDRLVQLSDTIKNQIDKVNETSQAVGTLSDLQYVTDSSDLVSAINSFSENFITDRITIRADNETIGPLASGLEFGTGVSGSGRALFHHSGMQTLLLDLFDSDNFILTHEGDFKVRFFMPEGSIVADGNIETFSNLFAEDGVLIGGTSSAPNAKIVSFSSGNTYLTSPERVFFRDSDGVSGYDAPIQFYTDSDNNGQEWNKGTIIGKGEVIGVLGLRTNGHVSTKGIHFNAGTTDSDVTIDPADVNGNLFIRLNKGSMIHYRDSADNNEISMDVTTGTTFTRKAVLFAGDSNTTGLHYGTTAKMWHNNGQTLFLDLTDGDNFIIRDNGENEFRFYTPEGNFWANGEIRGNSLLADSDLTVQNNIYANEEIVFIKPGESRQASILANNNGTIKELFLKADDITITETNNSTARLVMDVSNGHLTATGNLEGYNLTATNGLNVTTTSNLDGIVNIGSKLVQNPAAPSFFGRIETRGTNPTLKLGYDSDTSNQVANFQLVNIAHPTDPRPQDMELIMNDDAVWRLQGQTNYGSTSSPTRFNFDMDNATFTSYGDIVGQAGRVVSKEISVMGPSVYDPASTVGYEKYGDVRFNPGDTTGDLGVHMYRGDTIFFKDSDASATVAINVATGNVTVGSISSGGDIKPQYNETVADLGDGTKRWDDIFLVNSPNVASDGNIKTNVQELSEAELRVASKAKLLVRKFQFIDAIDKKGEENARYHIGVIAQDLHALFEEEGLDAFEYGILCYDDILDSDGNPSGLGGQYSVRYTELLAFIIAAL